jgi:arylsulfatase A-like enzyme
LGGPGFYPESQGFDINKGGFEKGSPMGGYYSPYKNPRLSDGPKGEYLTDRLTDETITFIEERDQYKPFAVFLSFYNVHTPIQPNLKHIDYYKEKLKAYTDNKTKTDMEGDAISVLNQRNADYASMVHSTDENIGKLISFLKQKNLYDNTLIIFTSDNGGLSTQEKVAPTSTKPLRAGKGWLYEGGIRIPQLIKFVNQKQQDLNNIPVVSYDLFTTIVNHLKLDYLDEKKDGIDLSNLSQEKNNRDYILWHFPHYHGSLWKPGSAIRNGDWKLLRFYEENKLELYNLKDDLSEQTDLSIKYPLIVKKLSNKMDEMLTEMNGKVPTINQNLN